MPRDVELLLPDVSRVRLSRIHAFGHLHVVWDWVYRVAGAEDERAEITPRLVYHICSDEDRPLGLVLLLVLPGTQTYLKASKDCLRLT